MLAIAAMLGPLAQGRALDAPAVESPDASGPLDAVWTDNMSETLNSLLALSPVLFWTSMNDGPSSGLDADLLDGLNSSYYLTLISNESAARESAVTTVATDLTKLVADTFDGALDELGNVSRDLMTNLTNVETQLRVALDAQELDIERIDELTGSLLENLTLAQTVLTLVQGDILGVQGEITNVSVGLSALDVKEGLTNASALRAEAASDRLKGELVLVNSTIDGIKTDMSGMATDINVLEGTANVTMALVVDALERVETAKAEVAGLQADVDVLRSTVADLENVDDIAASAEASVTSLRGLYELEIPDLQAKVNTLLNATSDVDEALLSLADLVNGMQTLVDSVDGTLTYLNNTLIAMEDYAVLGQVELDHGTANLTTVNAGELNANVVARVGALTNITSGRMALGSATLLDTTHLAVGASKVEDGLFTTGASRLTDGRLELGGSTLTGTTLDVAGSTLTGSTLNVGGSTLTGNALQVGTTTLSGTSLALQGNTLSAGGLTLPANALVSLGSSTLSGTQLHVAGTTLDAEGLVAGAASLDKDGILAIGTSTVLDATKLQIGTSILDDALSLGTDLLGTDLLAGGLHLGNLLDTAASIRLGDLTQMGGTGVGLLVGATTSIKDGQIDLGTGTTLTDGLVSSTNVKVNSLTGCSIVSTSATGLLSCSGIDPATLVRTSTNVGTSGGLQGGGTLGSGLSLSIADGGVSTAKLADGTISTAKIADSAVTASKLVSVPWSILTGLPAACASGQAIQALTASGATCVSAGGTLSSLSVTGGASFCTADGLGCEVRFSNDGGFVDNNDGWTTYTGHLANSHGIRVAGNGGNVEANGYVAASKLRADGGTLRFREPTSPEGTFSAASFVESPWDLYFRMDVEGDDDSLGQTGGSWFRVWTNGQAHEQMRIMWGDEAPALFDGAVTANGLDLAEAYINGDALLPGELVRIDPLNPHRVLRTTGADDAGVLGVVSTAPGLVLSDGIPSEEDLADLWGSEVLALWKVREPIIKATIRAADTKGVLDDVRVHEAALVEFADEALAKIALAGRVPVKVDASYGAIEAGDLLAASPIPGVAMKAKDAGTTIGVALQALPAGKGAISMFVQRGHLSSPIAAPSIPLGLSEGDVVAMDGFTADGKLKVKPAASARDPNVIGVVSTRATQTLDGVDRNAPIAATGIVTVKVVGPVATGALLTSSATPGHAASCADATDCGGAVIGKALEAHSGVGAGTIRMLVTLG